MPKYVHHDAMKRLASRALEMGARRVSAVRIEWDLAANCQAPKTREIISRPDPGNRRWLLIRDGGSHPLHLELTIRCRKCDRCLSLRRALWSARARSETRVSIRTWFGTLTITPDRQYLARAKARLRVAQQGVDFDVLPFGEQFNLLHREFSPEITKYLKRIRKECGGPLRFLCVAEHHKSGNPHYHLLIHEGSFLSPVKERTLRGQWKLGFSKWKLVDDLQQATYLAKYLAKASVARVRASQGYGNHALNCIAEALQKPTA